MANWKKITTDADLTAISASLTTTDQAISASVAALSGSASTARGLLSGGGDPFPHTGSAEITGSLGVTGSVSFSTEITTVGAAVWSAGGALATGRHLLAGAGTQTAGLAFGGYDAGFYSAGGGKCTEEYNGSSWSAGGDLNIGRTRLMGTGTQTAALAIAGYDPVSATNINTTEEYNGSTWSTIAGGNTINLTQGRSAFGITSATVAVDGIYTEEFNGATWSTGNALSTTRYTLAGAGTQTAGLAFGGYISFSARSCTEEYNGTSWTAGGALSTARYELAGAGTQNAGLAFGGGSPYTNATEEYNGSSWAAGSALATARSGLAGAGTQTAALAFGGYTRTTSTEEYSPSTTLALTKTFDYSESTGAVILSQVSSSLNFVDDTAAATGGIPLGGLYRNGNFIVIRLT